MMEWPLPKVMHDHGRTVSSDGVRDYTKMQYVPQTCTYGIEVSGSRSIEHDVIVAVNKRNQGSLICVHQKATPHAVVAVKTYTYNNFPVPDHLIQNYQGYCFGDCIHYKCGRR